MLSQNLGEQMSGNLSPNKIITKTCKEIEESNCSCSQCDLVSCFELRNQKSNSSCTCSLCKSPKTCANSRKEVNNKEPNSKNVNETKIKNDIEQIEKELYEEITKVANSEFDNREYTKFSSKDISLKKDKTNWNMKGKSSTRQYIHSVAINYLPKESKNSTAKLSAQIMNMPYQDFKDSLTVEDSRKKSSSSNFKDTISVETSHKNSSPFDIKDIVKPDFLTRLKEIYNACSCKICECITGTSLPFSNDECKCKPCDCGKCTNYMTNFKHDIKHAPHDGCPCVSCNRKDCRGVVKKIQDEKSCNCIPCNCVKYSENFTKSCNCEPCQCIECKALGVPLLRTVIVAPVHGNVQHNLCQCEPCECVNCTHNYSAMSSNLRHQISTEIISNGNCHCEGCLDDACQLNSEVCRCDLQNKVMKKPLVKTSRDYDIHRALISDQNECSKYNNHDTIATFALCNNYSNTISHSKGNRDECECSKCECFVCKDKKYKEDIRKSHNEKLNSKAFIDCFDTCKCSPRECRICESDNQKSTTAAKRKIRCECNKCDCFVCKELLIDSKFDNKVVKSKIINPLFQESNHVSCETSCFSKKGKLLTPSTFEANLRYESQLQTCKREIKKLSYLNDASNKSSCRKLSRKQILTACHSEAKHINNGSIYEKVIKFENSELPSKHILLNDCCLNADIKNIEDIKKSFTLFKNGSNNNVHNELRELFNARKQNPIRDIELLDKFIHLAKSSSKTNIPPNEVVNSKNDKRNSNNSVEIVSLDGKPVPCIQITPKESVHTIISSATGSESIDFNEKQNSETLPTPSDCIILYDKKSSPIESNEFENNVGFNATNNNNNLENELKVTNAVSSVDSIAISHNDKSFTDKLNEFVTLNSDTLDKDLKVEEKECNIAKSITKLSKNNTDKHRIKGKGNKYNKIYNRLGKRSKKIIKTNEKSVETNHYVRLETKENTFSDLVENDVWPMSENALENLECALKNAKDLFSRVQDSLATISVEKLLTNKNVMDNIIETQTQNIDSDGDNEAWSIMRKNLYLSCTQDVKNKGICTIPAMGFDINATLKSISIQTSECGYDTRKSNGKHALTRLLNEVNDLLNSPLLQSSHSNKKSTEQEWNDFSKSKLDLEFKIIHNDATSQTHSKCSHIDKETCCNLIQSMEIPQQNIKHLMDNVLTKAVYKSELSTTKLNLTQGYKNIPKINSCKSSCHGLKATFVALRTISDHTVMVKWRLPREVIFVQGYELQVDGRPVQKIFSPTRCMAILTCLPHSEKLLLTIRTLTTSILPSDHQPANTIVYRPHVK